MKINFFDPITVVLANDKIYNRLGYSSGITQVSDKQKDKLTQYIDNGLSFINLKGAAVRIPIDRIDSLNIRLIGGVVFRSNSLAQLLGDCREVLIMAASAGDKIVEAIRNNSSGQDVTAAVVFDALASEMVDSALDWIINYFNRQLRRENKQLKRRRFSAGYGDFSLDNQKAICETLGLKKLGISLTEEYMLVPEKTVTAVGGIQLIGG